jgi:hypothetical protein
MNQQKAVKLAKTNKKAGIPKIRVLIRKRTPKNSSNRPKRVILLKRVKVPTRPKKFVFKRRVARRNPMSIRVTRTREFNRNGKLLKLITVEEPVYQKTSTKPKMLRALPPLIVRRVFLGPKKSD